MPVMTLALVFTEIAAKLDGLGEARGTLIVSWLNPTRYSALTNHRKKLWTSSSSGIGAAIFLIPQKYHIAPFNIPEWHSMLITKSGALSQHIFLLSSFDLKLLRFLGVWHWGYWAAHACTGAVQLYSQAVCKQEQVCHACAETTTESGCWPSVHILLAQGLPARNMGALITA